MKNKINFLTTICASLMLSSCLVVKVYQKSPDDNPTESKPVATDHRMIGSGKTVEIDGTVSEILFYDEAAKPDKILLERDEIIPSSVSEDSLNPITERDSKTEVNIRVNRSKPFQKAQPPLYVLNGAILPEGSSLDSLNPKDIERIDVYKGPKAFELYGDKGKHGVVVIKMKDKTARTTD